MLLKLAANEARVIGCLMEKSVVTPDQYPLTLNSLTNACNQKSSRDPVMSLDKTEVQRTAHGLRDQHLVRVEENFKTGLEKYLQRFCNTQLADYQFDPAQFAVVCLLLLRGAQTPGELRARSGRLHTFADNAAVEDVLTALIEWQTGPLVVKLPRTPGRRDAEYMHLFSGPVDVAALESTAKAATKRESTKPADVSELERRVSKLESEVAELKARLPAS
ncbi:MAG: YceH family protein [Gammaproteobacteria bacterium]